MLTPFETILINKLMPYGYKLESEENLNETDSMARKLSNLKQNNHKKFKRIKEHNEEEKKIKKIHKTKNKNGISSSSTSINQKMEYVMSKIKQNEFSAFFFSNVISKENFTSLSVIEKNIGEGIYKSVYTFFLDLRKFLIFYIENYQDNKEIYDKTLKMIEQIETLAIEIEKMHERSKSVKSLYIGERPMTVKEKSTLANYIRGLPEDQLKGLVNLLDEETEMDKRKGYFEVDIEKLSNSRLREIEKYVKSCMKSTKNFIPARYLEEFEHKKKKEKEEHSENKEQSENKEETIKNEKENN